MYSPDAANRHTAGAVMEHVQSYLFSCLSSSSRSDESGQADPDAAIEGEPEFQIIQATFLMVITLFWGGSESQKYEAATELFDRVIEVRTIWMHAMLEQQLMEHTAQSARSLGLMTCVQSLQDRQTEALWLAKECRIR